MNRRVQREAGLTIIEVVTVLVVIIVVAAIAIPSWNNYQLRQRRAGAVDMLLAIQAAQDKFFATQAHYADDAQTFSTASPGLGVNRQSAGSFYRAEVQRSRDRLGYVAVATASDVADARADPRCREFRLDDHDRRWSLDAKGEDSTADCWNRL